MINIEWLTQSEGLDAIRILYVIEGVCIFIVTYLLVIRPWWRKFKKNWKKRIKDIIDGDD